jgi:hypothetical protein
MILEVFDFLFYSDFANLFVEKKFAIIFMSSYLL